MPAIRGWSGLGMSVRKGTVAEVSGVEGSSESWKPLPFGMGAGMLGSAW
jgi:hypothetical protein